MLDGGLDQMYRKALATQHQPYLLVEVLDGNQQLLSTLTLDGLPTVGQPEGGLVYISGSVDATLTSRVSRNLSLTVAQDLYPFEATGLLAPYGNMLRAWRGIQYADGGYIRWQTFLGRIQSATLTPGGTCQVRASDRGADVIESRFLVPQNAQVGTLVSSEIRRLISDAVPDATFGVSDTFTERVSARTWQLDRGQALDELATSVGSFWYPLANGEFVQRRYPWTVPSTPVVTYTDGPGGSMVAYGAIRSRQDVYNSLTVTGERLNGDAAVYATAQDTTPGSITNINGTFGRRHQLARLQNPATQGAAQGAASDNLRRLIALVDIWSWSMAPDASLELGDAVRLDTAVRAGVVQVVAGFRLPMDLSGPMTVTGRSQVVGVLEGIE